MRAHKAPLSACVYRWVYTRDERDRMSHRLNDLTVGSVPANRFCARTHMRPLEPMHYLRGNAFPPKIDVVLRPRHTDIKARSQTQNHSVDYSFELDIDMDWTKYTSEFLNKLTWIFIFPAFYFEVFYEPAQCASVHLPPFFL